MFGIDTATLLLAGIVVIALLFGSLIDRWVQRRARRRAEERLTQGP